MTKLKEVWALGGTDSEAASWADISTKSISRYIEAKPEVAELRDKLKERPILKARQTVVKNLDHVGVSQWYLEKKRKLEFGPSVELPTAPPVFNFNLINNNPQIKQAIVVFEDQVKKAMMQKKTNDPIDQKSPQVLEATPKSSPEANIGGNAGGLEAIPKSS